jgi:Asp/Glu/hydantoin racemase
MKRVVLVNPNTSQALTALMVQIAREHLPAGVQLEGLTVPSGPPLITCDDEFKQAADTVRRLAPELARNADAVIVSAFGDPGADELAARLDRPVVGIAAAAMRAAAAGGRRFAVVTHVPALRQRMTLRAAEVGFAAQCVGVLSTEGDPAALMATPAALESALHALAERAVAELDAGAIIVGGGPLGLVAKALRDRVRVPVIEAIPEAVRHLIAVLGVVSAD